MAYELQMLHANVYIIYMVLYIKLYGVYKFMYYVIC